MTRLGEPARSWWARTRARSWPDPCVMARLPLASAGEAARCAAVAPFAALVMDRDECSLTIARSLWEACPLRGEALGVEGPLRAITLDVRLPPDLTGYLAPLAARLAEAGIAIIPQCGFSRDHILVREEDAARALTLIEELIAEAAAG